MALRNLKDMLMNLSSVRQMLMRRGFVVMMELEDLRDL